MVVVVVVSVVWALDVKRREELIKRIRIPLGMSLSKTFLQVGSHLCTLEIDSHHGINNSDTISHAGS